MSPFIPSLQRNKHTKYLLQGDLTIQYKKNIIEIGRKETPVSNEDQSNIIHCYIANSQGYSEIILQMHKEPEENVS